MTDDFKPFLIAWNLTRRCNLRCDHCYLSAGERESGAADELSTEECFRVVDEISRVNPHTMLVLTGGEPLLRKDLSDIARYASQKGMMVVVGTNGTLLTDQKVTELLDCGILGVSISMDSLNAGRHDSFRCRPGALAGAIEGMEVCRRQGLAFQVHTTVTQFNVHEIPDIMDFAHQKGAKVFNLFFLVCTGRGEMMSDITPEAYEQTLSYLADAQGSHPGMLVRARCAPHFKRILYEKNPQSPLTMAQGYEGGGCLAGTHYCRITPEGDVTPCPYMPLSVGNLRSTDFTELWDASPVFDDFRHPVLKGKCGDCEYNLICGGCRARPYASHEDYLDEDLWCLYTPQGGKTIEPAPPSPGYSVVWTEESTQRLQRLPFFLQEMVKRRVEQYTVDKGETLVTPVLMEEVRRRTFGNETPVFETGGKGGWNSSKS